MVELFVETGTRNGLRHWSVAQSIWLLENTNYRAAESAATMLERTSFPESAKSNLGRRYRARRGSRMKRTDKAKGEFAGLDELIDEITTDANGDAEQLWAFRQAFEDGIAVPCDATVIGEPVQVLKFDFDGNETRGLTAVCRRPDGTKHEVAAAEVVIPLSEQSGRYLAAYRKWMGIAPLPTGRSHCGLAEASRSGYGRGRSHRTGGSVG